MASERSTVDYIEQQNLIAWAEQPNLVLVDAMAPPAATFGETIDLTWTVANESSLDATSSWSDAVYLSEDAILDANDTQLLLEPGTSLLAGESYTRTTRLTLPASGTGSYLLFVADDRDNQPEPDESDNLQAIPFIFDDLPGARSATVGTDIFLGGNFIELGINQWGSFGTASGRPADFFGTRVRSNVGMSADFDGFGTGEDLRIDYFLPGTPEERWVIGYRNDGITNVASNADRTGSRQIPNNVVNTSDETTLSAVSTGFYNDTLSIVQEISFGVNDSYFRNIVTLTNVSVEAIDDVRYMRSFDPDNTVDQGGSFITDNTVRAIVAEDGSAVVEARTFSDSDPIFLATGSRAPIFFFSNDERAVASTFGFTNTNPYVAAAYDSPAAKDNTIRRDQAITLTFDVGTLLPGESTTLVYFTSLDDRDFEDVLGDIERPDLIIESITAPGSAQFGEVLNLNWELSNVGIATAEGGWSDRIYLSRDTVLDSSDRLLTSVATGDIDLAPGETLAASATVTLPLEEGFSDGTYFLLLQADALNNQVESDETNNLDSVTIDLTVPPQPDLFVSSITTPTTAFSGEPLSVSWTVTNQGEADASGPWTARVYLSDDSAIGGDTFYRDVTFDGTLAAGESLVRSTTIEPPLGLTGDFYAVVETDFGNAVTELGGEDNNIAIASAPVTLSIPPQPDLVVSSISAPIEAFSGQAIEITWTLTNQGEADASGTWQDFVYLSDDDQIGGDRFFESFAFSGAIAAGESVERRQLIDLPNEIEGDFRAVVVTDATNSLTEFGFEDNNAAIDERAIAIELAPFPNLQVSQVIAPPTAFSSREVVIEWDVTNVGTGPTSAPSWSDRVWLSLDTVFDGSDILLGSATNPSFLAPGASYRNQLTATLPQGIDGNYFFIVQTDANNRVFELDGEEDNVRVSNPTDVELTPPPDLQLASVNAPSQAFSGQPLELSWTIVNDGPGATLESSWRDEIYLSADTTLDGEDIRLGSRTRNGVLASNETYNATQSLTLPVGISGDFFFIVRTDAGNQVYENVFENNNDGFDTNPTTVNLTPPPDLEVETVTLPASARAGTSLTIDYRVTNFGATPTPNSSWRDAIYLSTDSQFDPDSDLLLGSSTRFGTLDIGESYDNTTTFPLDNALEGNLFAIVVTDGDDVVFEIDNDNNIAVSATSVAVTATPADLSVTSAILPPTVEAGGALSVDWSVANLGSGDTIVANWRDRLILSSNATFGDGDDLILGEFARNELLAPGETYQRSEVVEVPFSLDGEYNLFVQADATDAVFESDEGNNVTPAQPVTVTRQTPDLQVTFVTASSATGFAGDPLQVTWGVQNLGAGETDANFWYDNIYLSTDPFLDADDLLLGRERRSNALEASASYEVTVSFSVPLLEVGDFFVLVQADAENGVTEDALENNNVTATDDPLAITPNPNPDPSDDPNNPDLPPELTPDLSVISVDAPLEGISGQALAVSWTVSNTRFATGDRAWFDAVYLSRDQIFDRETDVYLGAVERQGGLESNQSYTTTQAFTIPRGLSGPYYVFVATDSSDRIFEREAELNNSALDGLSTDVVLPPPVDLAAGTISVPATGVPGQPATLTYTVNNLSSEAAIGSWVDSLYLSADETWDLDDPLVTQVSISGPIAGGGSYTRTVSAELPGVTPGDYQLIVRSDIRNQLPEGDEENNLGVSTSAIAVDAERLELGMPDAGTLAENQSIFYRLTVAAGETLLVNFDSDLETAANELYLRYGDVPSRNQFDFSFSDAFASDQEIVVPTTRGGTYYILAFGDDVPDGTQNYTLEADLIDFSLRDIGPTFGSNLGQVTLNLSGAKFTSKTTANLVAPDGTVLNATQLLQPDSTQLWATFNLEGSQLGLYDVQIADGAQTAVLTDSFTVTDGPTGFVEYALRTPRALRPGQAGLVTVDYVNAGETDVTAPLLNLDIENGLLQLPELGGFTEDSLQFLAIDDEGPAGILAPGDRGSISFAFRPTATAGSVNLQLDPFATDGTIDWSARREDLGIETFSIEAQEQVLANLTVAVGNTGGELQAVLAESATYFNQIGERTSDAGDLLGFQLQLASDFQEISKRNRLGSFGRGQFFVGDIQAVSNSNGDLIISNSGIQELLPQQLTGTALYDINSQRLPLQQLVGDSYDLGIEQLLPQIGGGRRRQFERQPDGSFRDASGATVTQEGDQFRLREANGTVVVFRPDGGLEYVENANGYRLSTEYDQGRLVSLSASNGDTFTFSYNSQGYIEAIADQTGQTASFGYDSTDELLTTIAAPLLGVSYTYDDPDNPTAITEVVFDSGTQENLKFDRQGRLQQRSIGTGEQVLTYSYDTQGGLAVTDADGASSQLLRNTRGQLSRTIDPLGRSYQRTYDEAGNITSLLGPQNFSLAFTYDEQGNLTEQVDALGQVTQFAYGPDSDLLASFTDPRGNGLSYGYDARGNLETIAYPDDTQQRFIYESDRGLLTETINRRGQSRRFTYNEQFQLTEEVSVADGSTTAYTYDPGTNQLTAITDSRGTTEIDFDLASNQLTLTDPANRTLVYTFNEVGERTQLLVRDASSVISTVNYAYNAAGRLDQLTNGSGDLIVDYTYDPITGLLEQEDKGNGTSTTYTYDAASQLTSLVNFAADGAVNSRFDYTYDSLGQRTSATTLDGTWNYSYDVTGQLTRAVFSSINPDIPDQDLTYVYDAVGNRIQTIENGATTDYQTNNLNQYATAGAASFGYDADGNLTSKTEGSEAFTYTYDDQNRLTQVTEANGQVTEYEYDAFGNRVATTVNGQRIEYLIDPLARFGSDVVAEFDDSGNLVSNYTHGLGLVNRVDSSNDLAFYDADAIGSIVGLTDGTGAVLNRYSYRPFGEDFFESETVDNPFEFVGKFGVTEEASGLDFMRARYYDSVRGRFTAPDPIGFQGGDSNFYRYVLNDPVDFADPAGTFPPAAVLLPVVLGGAGGLGAGLLLSCLGGEAGSALGAAAAFGAVLAAGSGVPGAGAAAAGLAFGRFVCDNSDSLAAEPPDDPIDPNSPDAPDSPNGPGGPGASVPIVAPSDPNDILGPEGFGDERWVPASDTLPYTIRFENQESATAPAQQVVITNQLDPDLDFRTFRLSNFGWSGQIFEVPENRSFYADRVDLTEELGFLVDVFAGIDVATGLATWTLITIDPETGEIPEDPLVGFLPPNLEPPEGDGFVTYSIQPGRDVPTGTVIDAEATIVFDTEEPIDTPPIFNTLDAIAPTATVAELPATSEDEAFLVSWSGSDDEGGSAIASYTVYVAINGGSFEVWLEDTTLTEAPYTGEPGSSYAFAAIAADNAGNREAFPTVAEATITLASDNLAPVLTGTVTALSYTEDTPPLAVDAGITLTDPDSPDFADGTLTATLTGATAADRLSFIADASIVGSDLLYQGTPVGSATGGTGGDPLNVTFNANATPTIIESLLQSLAYQNLSDAPDPATRTLTVAVTDGDGGTSNELAIALNVIPVNDPPAIATPIPDQNAVEDTPFSFTFASDAFNDPDGDSLTYSARQTDGDPLPDWLNFEAATRTFSGTPSNEDVGSLAIAVTATDPESASISDDFVLAIANTNDPPTGIEANNLLVSENAPNGKVIATLTTIDPDPDDSHTYTLLDDANGRFAVVGDELQVADADQLDFEAAPSHSVRVQSTDSGGERVEQSLTVQLRDDVELDLTGTPGDDTIVSPYGGDLIAGNGGSDTFVYPDYTTVGDTIADFNPDSDDRLDVSALFAPSYFSSARLFEDYIDVQQTGSDVQVQWAIYGDFAPDYLYPLAELQNTNATLVDASDFVFA